MIELDRPLQDWISLSYSVKLGNALVTLARDEGARPNNDRRFIEDLIPIREISAEASREKSLRHGNISTLHLWWARRPIVAARAAVYGALVPAPADAKERETYMARMRKLCSWDIPNGGLEQARKAILEANGGEPPPTLPKSNPFLPLPGGNMPY